MNQILNIDLYNFTELYQICAVCMNYNYTISPPSSCSNPSSHVPPNKEFQEIFHNLLKKKKANCSMISLEDKTIAKYLIKEHLEL